MRSPSSGDIPHGPSAATALTEASPGNPASEVAIFGDLRVLPSGMLVTPSGTVPLSSARLEYAGAESQQQSASTLGRTGGYAFAVFGVLGAVIGIFLLFASPILGALLIVLSGLVIWLGERGKKQKVRVEMVTVTTHAWTHYAQDTNGRAVDFITSANRVRAGMPGR